MENWAARLFGPLNAEDYDTWHNPGTTQSAVELIAAEAQGGRVLEFAVGTGRIALPLAARGLSVAGIELAPEMIAQLRDKPGGAELEVVEGDMASVRVAGEFDLVVLVYNTLFNLVSQAEQKAVFANAARHLRPGGRFLVETFVPDTSVFHGNEAVHIKAMELDTLALDAVRHDPVEQVLRHQRLWVQDGQVRLVPLVMRYAYPPELDLTAELAGLTLQNRWGDWSKGPFEAASRMHVSVWEKPG